MQWTDQGVVLATRRHGERALIVDLLTREHGRHAGLLRGGQAPRLRAQWQIGNRLTVTWRARLADHLGSISRAAPPREPRKTSFTCRRARVRPSLQPQARLIATGCCACRAFCCTGATRRCRFWAMCSTVSI